MIDFKALTKLTKKLDTVKFEKYDDVAYITDTRFIVKIPSVMLDELLFSLHVIPEDKGCLTIIKGKGLKKDSSVPDMRKFLEETVNRANLRVFNNMKLESTSQGCTLIFFSDGIEISAFDAGLLSVFSNPASLRQTSGLSPGIVEINKVFVGMVLPVRMKELPEALEELKRLRVGRRVVR